MATFDGVMNGKSRLGALGFLVHTGAKKPLMVWRVQNAAGIGPYQADPDNDEAFAVTRDRALYRFIASGDQHIRGDTTLVRGVVTDLLQPSPVLDFNRSDWEALPYDTQKQYLFGFPTKQSVTSWFGPSKLRELAKKGFHVVQVPARRVVLSSSGKQVIFVPWPKQYRKPPSNYLSVNKKKMRESF